MPHPKLGHDCFVADSARICGEVTLGDLCTIMHHVTIRGDVSAIRIGDRVNVQDGSVIHTQSGVPLEIESDVGIGHRAVVHCKKIHQHSLIGIGAIVLDDAVIGSHCVIAAGALITPGTEIPDGKLVVGIPGRILRDTTEQDRLYIQHVIDSYQNLNRLHTAGEFPELRDLA
jgi:carbonic anhydrase/acetyltransferase-like protein (isoleucine patch superfamily)